MSGCGGRGLQRAIERFERAGARGPCAGSRRGRPRGRLPCAARPLRLDLDPGEALVADRDLQIGRLGDDGARRRASASPARRRRCSRTPRRRPPRRSRRPARKPPLARDRAPRRSSRRRRPSCPARRGRTSRPSRSTGSNGAAMPSTPTVSMCPQNISERPGRRPSSTPMTFGRPGATSCISTSSPMRAQVRGDGLARSAPRPPRPARATDSPSRSRRGRAAGDGGSMQCSAQCSVLTSVLVLALHSYYATDVSRRVAAITGASSGIGLAARSTSRARGVAVVLGARRVVAARGNGRADPRRRRARRPISMDVTREADVRGSSAWPREVRPARRHDLQRRIRLLRPDRRDAVRRHAADDGRELHGDVLRRARGAADLPRAEQRPPRSSSRRSSAAAASR